MSFDFPFVRSSVILLLPLYTAKFYKDFFFKHNIFTRTNYTCTHSLSIVTTNYEGNDNTTLLSNKRLYTTKVSLVLK